MLSAVEVVPAVVAEFAAGFGEAAVAAGLVEAGAGTAVTFGGGEMTGEAAAEAGGAAGTGLVAGPAGVGLAGGAFSSSTGARFPIFDKSGPNLILPSTTGRSKR